MNTRRGAVNNVLSREREKASAYPKKRKFVSRGERECGNLKEKPSLLGRKGEMPP